MKKSRLRDYIESLILVVIIALMLRHFFLYPCRINDNDMSPTLKAGDFIWSYNLAFGRWAARSPEKNELVIFELPNEPGVLLARRILGVEGDVIQTKTAPPLIIPPGYFFAKADNLPISNNAAQGDGLVPVKQLRGKIWKIWFSVNSKDNGKAKTFINWKRIFKTVN
mgnify:FL=1